MPELKNTFSWSPSRHRTFETCRRQYYFNYYGSWGGWKGAADAHTRLVYQLKKMTTLPQLVGTVVHDVIGRALKAMQTRREVPRQTARTYAVQLFDRHLDDSQVGRWRQSASRYAHLFEHYYNLPLDLDAARRRVSDSVEAFFDSQAFADLRVLPPGQWLCVEELESFFYNDTKVWVTLDVAVRQQGRVHIFDWKTGRERQADQRQLAVYALYASATWGVPVPNLVLQDIYLQQNTVRTVAVDASALDETRQFMVQSMADMRALLDDPETNAASPEAFPMIEDCHTCQACSFKAVCYPADDPAEKPAREDKPVQLSLF